MNDKNEAKENGHWRFLFSFSRMFKHRRLYYKGGVDAVARVDKVVP